MPSPPSWFFESWDNLAVVALQAGLAYLVILALTRLAGLRSTSKMSSTDFFITLSIGSIFATAILSTTIAMAECIVALAVMFVIKVGISRLKVFDLLQHVLDNDPVIVMVGTTMLHDQMKPRAVTKQDICSKLREANVTHPNQILAVVLETTGDISVIWSDRDQLEVDYHIFTGTKNPEVLRQHPLPSRFVLKEADAFSP